MSVPPDPCDPAAMTPTWLTRVLWESGAIDGADVDEVAWEIIGQEWGFTGVIARVRPRYSHGDDSFPVTLVAKFPGAVHGTPSLYQKSGSCDEESRRRSFARSAREVSFYRQIVPEGDAPVPRLYYGRADSETRCIVLLLEDLRGAAGDVIRGCSPVQANAVLQAMAPFHANWWQAPALDTISWLPRWGQDLPARAQRYAANVEPFLARFGSRMPQEAQDLIRNLVDSYIPLLSELAGVPMTIIHGDLHLDNVIFGSSEIEPAVWIIDWQGVMRGPAVLDLAFLANSLHIDARRESEQHVLERYHATLTQNGIIDYPFHRLRRDYHLALLSNLAGDVMWLGSADLDGIEGRQRAMIDAIVDEPRLLTALLDTAPEALP